MDERENVVVLEGEREWVNEFVDVRVLSWLAEADAVARRNEAELSMVMLLAAADKVSVSSLVNVRADSDKVIATVDVVESVCVMVGVRLQLGDTVDESSPLKVAVMEPELVVDDVMLNVTLGVAVLREMEHVSVAVSDSLGEGDVLLLSLSVSHSTSRRHPTYTLLLRGLHRPPCTPHQWQDGAPTQTSSRQISPVHDIAHRSRCSSFAATQYWNPLSLFVPPHHWHWA